MSRAAISTILSALLALTAPTSASAQSDQRRETAQDRADKAEIIAHIESIFQAFVDQDRDTIRATHSDDWTGFQLPAREITKGVDAYMANVGFVNPMQRFELEDYEVQIHGDIAIVFYIANWWNHLPAIDQYVKLRARSLDIYRRDGDGWIQSGSNINLVRQPGAARQAGVETFFDMEFSPTLPD